jgi:hypothetical protein
LNMFNCIWRKSMSELEERFAMKASFSSVGHATCVKQSAP